MVEYYLRIFNSTTSGDDNTQEEYGPYTADEYMAVIAGVQHKIRSGEITVKVRSNWPINPDSNQEWFADVDYLTDVEQLIPKNEQTPQPDPPSMPPRPNPYEGQPNLKKIVQEMSEFSDFSANTRQLLNAPEPDLEPLEEWEEELLRYNTSPLVKILHEDDGTDEEQYPEEETDEDSPDNSKPYIKLRDDGDEKWLIDKLRVRADILELFEDRLGGLFSLTEGEFPVEEDDDHPEYNNDGLEMAILDGYVTYEELVQKFGAKLRSYLKTAANSTSRDFREAINRDYVELDKARPNPTFLQNFDRSRRLPPADENDQTWVDHVPSYMRDRQDSNGF